MGSLAVPAPTPSPLVFEEDVSSSLGSFLEDILRHRRRWNDFRWASRLFNPSPYFSRGRAKEPKELISAVLSSHRVVRTIREVALKDGRDEKEVGKEAHSVLLEMAHDYHLYTIRWFAYVLSKLVKGHYSSIFVSVQRVPQIKECFQQYPVLLLPTHRSYVDFLLLSYVCFNYDLPLPVIAAGMDFMGMLGVAELLRKAGAFFIRRRFGNDSLYWSLISEYVKTSVLCGGHPLEMFVEGTRSRSGKTLFPKIGLLSVIAQLVRDREIPDVLILPISMSYDRTLEETLYARELLGQPKPKESTNGLLKGLKWLGKQEYGAMYVNFGSFISIREALGEPCSQSYKDDAIFSKRVQELSMQVVMEQQKNLLLPLFSGVAVVVLAKASVGETSLPFQSLVQHIQTFRSLLLMKEGSSVDFGMPLSGETLEWNIRHILSIHSSLIVCPKDEEHIVNFTLNCGNEDVEGMKFQHYANQLLPHILPHCLLALLEMEKETEKSVMGEYAILRELLFDDFIYDKGTEMKEASRALSTYSLFLPSSPDGEETRQILKFGVQTFLISYWGVAKTLDKLSSGTTEQEAVEMKGLAKMSASYVRQLLGAHFPLAYGSLSLDTLNNGIMGLIKMNFVEKLKLDETGIRSGVVVRDLEKLRNLITLIVKRLPINSDYQIGSGDMHDLSQLLNLKAKL